MIFPALKAAATDRRLGDTSLRVLVLLHGYLDVVHPRALKAWVLAQTLGIKPHTAATALRTLVRYGYLAEGPRLARRVGTYRVVLNVDVAPEVSTAIPQRDGATSPTAEPTAP